MFASTTRRAARDGGGSRPGPVVRASRNRLSDDVAEAIKNRLIEHHPQPGDRLLLELKQGSFRQLMEPRLALEVSLAEYAAAWHTPADDVDVSGNVTNDVSGDGEEHG